MLIVQIACGELRFRAVLNFLRRCLNVHRHSRCNLCAVPEQMLRSSGRTCAQETQTSKFVCSSPQTHVQQHLDPFCGVEMLRGGPQCFYHSTVCCRLLSLRCWQRAPNGALRCTTASAHSAQTAWTFRTSLCGPAHDLRTFAAWGVASMRQRQQFLMHTSAVRWQDVEKGQPDDDDEAHQPDEPADNDDSLSPFKAR